MAMNTKKKETLVSGQSNDHHVLRAIGTSYKWIRFLKAASIRVLQSEITSVDFRTPCCQLDTI